MAYSPFAIRHSPYALYHQIGLTFFPFPAKTTPSLSLQKRRGEIMDELEFKRVGRWGGITILLLIGLAAYRLGGAYIWLPFATNSRTHDLDSESYCIAAQIEEHRTPAQCPDMYKQDSAKTILVLFREDSTTEQRHQQAKKILGENTDSWTHGAYRSVFETMSSDERIRLYQESLQYSSSAAITLQETTRSAIRTYKPYFAQTRADHLRIIKSYKEAIKNIEIQRQSDLRFIKSSSVIGLLVVNVLSLILFLGSGRPRSDSSSMTRLNILMIFVPLVLVVEIVFIILSLIFLPHRTWLKGRYERKKLRIEFGDDILGFLDEIKGLEKKLRARKLTGSERASFEMRLGEVRRKVERLKEERKRTPEYLNATQPDPEAIIIDALDQEVTAAIEAETDVQKNTTRGLNEQIERLRPPAGVRET